jgi:hypothetical protein
MFHYHNEIRLQRCVIKAAEVEEYVSTKPPVYDVHLCYV